MRTIVLIIGGVLLLIALSIVVLQAVRQPATNTSSPVTESRTKDEGGVPQSSPQQDATPKDDTSKEVVQDAPIDPATLSTLDIPQAGISVSYVKGVGPFEYEVRRSIDGRTYVALMNSDLIGTKCSDDDGTFVSILESPNDSEKATVAKSVTVDGVEYGLSVASPTCTSAPDLLTRYQSAFIVPFSLLKTL